MCTPPESPRNLASEPSSPSSAGSRIPATLQAVFLASNRGKEVHKPPPERVACRVFLRNFVKSPTKSVREVFRTSSLTLNDLSCDITKEDSSSEDVTKPRRKKSRRSSLKSKSETSLSPKDYVDAMIESRGYSTKTYKTLETAYFNSPTDLQRASYDLHIIDLVRKHDNSSFQDVMRSGLSPNACNAHGESLVHLICRRGDVDLLQILIDLGCSLQVSDDHGRTPLHDACWTAKPCFELVEMILETDRRMLQLIDCRGAVPLSYVRKDNWAACLEFFALKKNKFWPIRNKRLLGEEEPPALALLPPNSRPLKDPMLALTPDLANMVAQGKLQPLEAQFLMSDDDDDFEDDDVDDDEVDSDDDDDDVDENDLDDEDLESLTDLVADFWGFNPVEKGLTSSFSTQQAKKQVLTQ